MTNWTGVELYCQVLKTSKDGDDTTSLGKTLHCSALLAAKNQGEKRNMLGMKYPQNAAGNLLTTWTCWYHFSLELRMFLMSLYTPLTTLQVILVIPHLMITTRQIQTAGTVFPLSIPAFSTFLSTLPWSREGFCLVLCQMDAMPFRLPDVWAGKSVLETPWRRFHSPHQLDKPEPQHL